MTERSSTTTPGNELRTAFRHSAGALLGVGVFSGVVNILGLTGSLYMLQVYDRVLPSQSVPTLVGITIVMVWLYAVYGLLDFVRLRLLVRIGNTLDRKLHGKAFAASLLLPLRAGPRGIARAADPRPRPDPELRLRNRADRLLRPALDAVLPAHHLHAASLARTAGDGGRGGQRAFDLGGRKTWPCLGAAGDGIGDNPHRLCRGGPPQCRGHPGDGPCDRFGRLWSEQSLRFLKDQRRVSDVVGATGALSRTLRMMLQSLMLGLGAYLVMSGEASSGVIIASSIMLARALAPVDIAIANWRGFMSARQSYAQLSKTLKAFADLRQPMALPRPRQRAFGRGA